MTKRMMLGLVVLAALVFGLGGCGGGGGGGGETDSTPQALKLSSMEMDTAALYDGGGFLWSTDGGPQAPFSFVYRMIPADTATYRFHFGSFTPNDVFFEIYDGEGNFFDKVELVSPTNYTIRSDYTDLPYKDIFLQENHTYFFEIGVKTSIQNAAFMAGIAGSFSLADTVDIVGSWNYTITSPNCPGLSENGTYLWSYAAGGYGLNFETTNLIDFGSCRSLGPADCSDPGPYPAPRPISESGFSAGMNSWACRGNTTFSSTNFVSSDSIRFIGNNSGITFNFSLNRGTNSVSVPLSSALGFEGLSGTLTSGQGVNPLQISMDWQTGDVLSGTGWFDYHDIDHQGASGSLFVDIYNPSTGALVLKEGSCAVFDGQVDGGVFAGTHNDPCLPFFNGTFSLPIQLK